MGTHCSIALERDDGTIIASYCHYDGYLTGVGATLVRHYSDPEKIQELISLGGMSTLGKTVNPSSDKHSFASPEKGVTVFYHRDRGESWRMNAPTLYDSFDEWFAANDQQYNYLYMEGSWMCRNGGVVTPDIADLEHMENF